MTTETNEKVYATCAADTLQIWTRNGQRYNDGLFAMGQIHDAKAATTGTGNTELHWLCVCKRSGSWVSFAMQTRPAAKLAAKQVRALLKANREAVADGK